MQTKTTSGNLTLNGRDLLKGALMAALAPAVTIIYQSIATGAIVFNWGTIGMASLAGGLSYLIKNWLSPAAIIVDAPKETVQAVKDGATQVKLETKP